MKKLLFQKTDIAPLAVFRIAFGFILAWHCFSHITSGQVKSRYIDPDFTFSHIGMEWLQPLPGNGMYYYFALMGILGLFIMAGLFYRYSMALFTVLWAGCYYMQKVGYNNHYYLMLLFCIFMLLLPANAYASVDSRIKPSLKKQWMPAWCRNVIILQIAIVYFYAAVAKLYPGWLDGTFTAIMLSKFQHPWVIELFSQKWFALFVAYSGLAFDFLIVPMLLWKKTRNFAVLASLLFHLFNSLVLRIGIFPYFSLSLIVFFYPPETIRKLFFPKKLPVQDVGYTSQGKKLLLFFFLPYFIIQLLLPVRHIFIKGDVMWTEEGHRLSWRMMLRSRGGDVSFKIIDKENGRELYYDLGNDLPKRHIQNMEICPDMIWQAAQYIKHKFSRQGIDVAVYVTATSSINRGAKRLLINPDTDLAAAKWDYFFHNEWIILYND